MCRLLRNSPLIVMIHEWKLGDGFKMRISLWLGNKRFTRGKSPPHLLYMYVSIEMIFSSSVVWWSDKSFIVFGGPNKWSRLFLETNSRWDQKRHHDVRENRSQSSVDHEWLIEDRKWWDINRDECRKKTTFRIFYMCIVFCKYRIRTEDFCNFGFLNSLFRIEY